jgi:hypothetical protein
MAIVGSNLTSGTQDAGSFSSVNTASITPTSNNLVLAAVAIRNGSSTAPTVSSITGNGLTWVQVATIQYDTSGASLRSITVYRALGASPSSGAVTINFSETETAYAYCIDQFSGIDTSGTNGSGAIVQSVTNKDETPPTGLTVTLAAFASVNNATYGAFGESNGYTQAVGSGFTELASPEASTEIGALTEWNSANDTSVDYSISPNTSQLGGIGIEIKAFVAASPTTITGLSSVTGLSSMVA